MACCLTAPSHYLSSCWLITSKVQWHSSECNFTRDTSATSLCAILLEVSQPPVTEISLKITYLKFCSNLSWANELNSSIGLAILTDITGITAVAPYLSTWRQISASHDDVIKWKHFPRYWPFVRGIHRSPVNSPHKGQWRGALMFSLICARING